MRSCRLGNSDLEISVLGLGCMPMTGDYGAADEAEALAAFERALDLGISFLDTADVYGGGGNERFLGRALGRTSGGRREAVVLASKFGQVPQADGSIAIDGRPEYLTAACDASLRRLGTDHLDLYYQHRVDPEVAIEETVGAMARLVEAGKVLSLGLSEASAATLRRAHAVHPISALQSEYSLWTRDPEPEVLPACRELGITLVCFSPLGRGFLGGKIRGPEDLGADDYRRGIPRFEPANMTENLRQLAELEGLAAARGVSPAQLALAWLLSRGEDVVPIPGCKRRVHVEDNAAAAGLTLTAAELASLGAAFAAGAASGARYRAPGLALINR